MLLTRFIRKHRVGIIIALLAGLALGAAAACSANRACQRASRGRIYRSTGPIPEREVALVLGTSRYTHRGAPNLHFNQRIDAAVALYRSGKIRHLLVSGDNHVQGYDEASDMRDALVSEGVPAGAITCDYAGFRTLDSVVRARTVFGLSRCTIVSEEFHCPRALWIAREHGLDAIAFAAPDLKSARWSLRVKAREVFARAWCGVDLYLLHRGPKFPGPPEPILISSQP
jgi:SanA protein